MGDSKQFKMIRKERMDEIGRCELCGSKRNLELHHCIPRYFGGSDSDDNLILVCGACHSRLTPKHELKRFGAGIAKSQQLRLVVERDEFYDELNRMLDEFMIVGADGALAAFNSKLRPAYVKFLNKEQEERIGFKPIPNDYDGLI